MKKCIALLLCAVVAFGLFAGCAAQSGAKQSAASASASSQPAASQAAVSTASAVSAASQSASASKSASQSSSAPVNDISKLKIGAFSNSTITDGGYTQAFNAGLQELKAKYSLSDDQVVLVENVYDGTPDVQNIIQQLINEGCNVIIGHSNGYNEDLDVFAQKYPNVQFYCYEGTTSDKVTTYSIDNLEVLYMLGYLCAKMSSNNELGFIAPMQNSHIIRSLDAFALGAKAANDNAKVRVMWVNSWWDPKTDKLCAETLIGEGIKALAYYGSTSAALQACEENKVFCTGFHIDMSSYAPDVCLSSFMWNWTPVLSQIVERYLSGDTSREMISGGINDDCARMAPLNDKIVPADVAAEVNALQGKLASGEIQVFKGPINDNTGKCVVKDGEVLQGKDLFSVMFLVDNVIGSLS